MAALLVASALPLTAPAAFAEVQTQPQSATATATATQPQPQADHPSSQQGETDSTAPSRGVTQRGMAGQALDRVKEVTKQAGDILARVPCLPPKGGFGSMRPLPRVARKLADGKPVVIVAFGSSSTQGYGSSSPAFTYPNRLATQLRRQYPTSDIAVINSGKGGEDAPEMMQRLKATVLDAKPDLVIWQVGTNAILRDLDLAETGKLIEEGIAAIQASGADVVMVDPQYAPRVNERAENANKMIKALGRLAELRRVGIFPRFEVMKHWHEQQALPFNTFVIADGLHMNDWGYACFAQLLGDGIIRSVGQIKYSVAEPADFDSFSPM